MVQKAFIAVAALLILAAVGSAHVLTRTRSAAGPAGQAADSGAASAALETEALNFAAAEEPRMTDNADTRRNMALRKAMFGAGCFWGVEAAFRRVNGVAETAVGYSGGWTENPTYKDVCTDRTGHAEVVLVTYDADKVSYEELLDVFWKCHDPTQLDRQGPDIGKQYRSVIFYFDEEQKAAAQASKAKLQESLKRGKNIVTEIAPASTFYRAEEYHQRHLEKRGGKSCASH